MMEVINASEAQRCAIYEGVHLLGWRAFREDRKEAAA